MGSGIASNLFQLFHKKFTQAGVNIIAGNDICHAIIINAREYFRCQDNKEMENMLINWK